MARSNSPSNRDTRDARDDQRIIELLEESAQLLADLPEALALLLEGDQGRLGLEDPVGGADASIRNEGARVSPIPLPVLVVNWPDDPEPPLAGAASLVPVEPTPPALPAQQQLLWPDAAEESLAAEWRDDLPELLPWKGKLLKELASRETFLEPGQSLEVPAEEEPAPVPPLAAHTARRAGTAADLQTEPIEEEDLFSDLPSFTKILSGETGAFEGEPVVGAPAGDSPGEGGSELSRMVSLLERIAAAVEGLKGGGLGNRPIPDTQPGSHLAQWQARQETAGGFDPDADEDFSESSPSFDTSSLSGGLGGASSVNRGFGSRYNKSKLGRSKHFDEPGGHG